MNDKLNSFYKSLHNKKVSFIGLGRSHRELIPMFASKGAIVTLRDKRTREQIGEEADKLETLGIKLTLGENYLENLCEEDIILRTPGMNYFTPALQQARKSGAFVTSEMELFFDLCPCKIYAVTGSDGKTTTTTVISEFLKAQGFSVFLGGNIGFPLLPRIEQIGPDDRAVVELSSFQLISMRKSPDVAVITNVAPNHLDVHKDMQEYIDAKRNIYLHQGGISRTVIQERMHRDGKWVNSGILKNDNTKMIFIGDIEKYYIFRKKRLLEYYQKLIVNREDIVGARKVAEKEHGTSKGFIMNGELANRENISVVDAIDLLQKGL